MAQIGTLNTFTNDVDEVTALPLQQNYVELSNKLNAHLVATTDVHGIVSPDYIISKQEIQRFIYKYYPLGTVRTCWEGSIEAQRLISSGLFQEFNGLPCSNVNSPYYGTILPNLDQCFIVGTTIAQTIATSVVNNSIKNFSHTHTNNHTHQIAAHTHPETHMHYFVGDGVLCKVMYDGNDNDFYVKHDGTGNTNGGISLYRGGGTDGQVENKTKKINAIGYVSNVSQNTGSKTAFNTDNLINGTVTDFSTGSVLLSSTTVAPAYLHTKSYLRII